MNGFPILLVEDDENDAFFFERAARKAGVENPLRIARDGREAVDYLAGKNFFADRVKHPLPGLVVLDINLPHYTGLEILRWIREQAGLRTLPVIILSSSSSEKDVREGYACGANSYLVKPGNPEEMVHLLQALKTYWLTVNRPPPSAATK